MTQHDILIVMFGALAGGYVSGLSGFGTALSTVGIWLHALEPATAATLTLICSVVSQLQTLPSMRADIDVGRVLPFIIPGLVGVPFGLWALSYVDPQVFKLGAGIFLVTFSCFMLAWRGQPAMAWGGRAADGAVGLIGGVLGGMAGLSGALPTVWASLRGWNKAQKRSVFGVFNLTILAAALVAHAVSGRVTGALAIPIAVALPGTLLGSWLGVLTYRRLNDRNFSDLVMGLLLMSGAALLFSLR